MEIACHGESFIHKSELFLYCARNGAEKIQSTCMTSFSASSLLQNVSMDIWWVAKNYHEQHFPGGHMRDRYSQPTWPVPRQRPVPRIFPDMLGSLDCTILDTHLLACVQRLQNWWAKSLKTLLDFSSWTASQPMHITCMQTDRLMVWRDAKGKPPSSLPEHEGDWFIFVHAFIYPFNLHASPSTRKTPFSWCSHDICLAQQPLSFHDHCQQVIITRLHLWIQI